MNKRATSAQLTHAFKVFINKLVIVTGPTALGTLV